MRRTLAHGRPHGLTEALQRAAEFPAGRGAHVDPARHQQALGTAAVRPGRVDQLQGARPKGDFEEMVKKLL